MARLRELLVAIVLVWRELDFDDLTQILIKRIFIFLVLFEFTRNLNTPLSFNIYSQFLLNLTLYLLIKMCPWLCPFTYMQLPYTFQNVDYELGRYSVLGKRIFSKGLPICSSVLQGITKVMCSDPSPYIENYLLCLFVYSPGLSCCKIFPHDHILGSHPLLSCYLISSSHSVSPCFTLILSSSLCSLSPSFPTVLCVFVESSQLQRGKAYL